MIGKSIYALVLLFIVVVLVGTAATHALANEGIQVIHTAITWFKAVTAK
jgi:hypothetical protein